MPRLPQRAPLRPSACAFMLPRRLLLCLICLASNLMDPTAWAINRCETKGAVSYSDMPCPSSGRSLPEAAPAAPEQAQAAQAVPFHVQDLGADTLGVEAVSRSRQAVEMPVYEPGGRPVRVVFTGQL